MVGDGGARDTAREAQQAGRETGTGTGTETEGLGKQRRQRQHKRTVPPGLLQSRELSEVSESPAVSAGEGVREVGGQHRFAHDCDDASSFAHMQGLKQTVQLAWNVQILNSERRSGMELEAEVGDGVWLGLYRLWRQGEGEENRAWGSGD